MAEKQPAQQGRPAPTAPRAIAKLPEHVVNRIAAGEIIQRPSNALKELIENSLDAGGTDIRVTVKEGGLKLLQIQDNGSGIRKDDLPILCERFTTSKIKAFEDLSSLGTYGFRGEALASISHVAHLSVTTKTREETCAWKAAYSDGQLIPVKAGSSDAAPVPCAGNDGTVEDLFYNTPQRLKSLRSASDEYGRIVSVVLAYSIHNAGVAMSCKKASTSSSATPDISTRLGASVLDNIGAHYGENVKRELVQIDVESKELNVKIKAWCSGANYQGKRGTYLFFINHRYVDCSPLKRSLEAFYGTLLAKGTHPFVYLSLEIDPTKIDVNVHPTKKEVGFEDEDEIVALVCEKLAEVLEKQGESRSYKVQTLLPSTTPKPTRNQSSSSSSATNTPAPSRKPSTSSSSKSKPKTAPNKLVRTDAQSQTLDALFPTLPSTSSSRSKTRRGVPADVAMYIDDEAGVKRRGKKGEEYSSGDDDDEEDEDEGDEADEADEDRPSAAKKKKMKHPHQSDHDPEFARRLAAEQAAGVRSARVRIAQSECALTSVRQLRKEVVEGRHEELDKIIKNHIFVGVADLASSRSMIQYQTKLYIIDHSSFAEELFYQLGLRQFGRFSRIKLNPPPNVKTILRIAMKRAEEVDGKENRAKSKLSGEEIVERAYQIFVDSAAMLDEYFSLSISETGQLESLPLILPGYSPDITKLPLFLLRLGVHVNWTDEKQCFTTFLRELAFFYSPSPSPIASSFPPPHTPGASPVQADVDEQRRVREEKEKHTIQHVLFPALKQYLVPPEGLLKKDVVLATRLEDLYRVFERC
ncbi:hypothetical protein JCM6882_008108 [Rhodosporidiobolus microsporus]